MIQVVLERASNPGRPGEALYFVELRDVPARGRVVVSRACPWEKALKIQAAWEQALDAYRAPDPVLAPAEPSKMSVWERLRHPLIERL